MKLAVLSLVATACLARQSSARGFIQCRDTAVERTSFHIATYSFDDGQTFTCTRQKRFCQDIVGVKSFENDIVDCRGNQGGHEKAAFWITSDGCYNIRSGGNRMYCCGVRGEVGRCTTTGFGPGKKS